MLERLWIEFLSFLQSQIAVLLRRESRRGESELGARVRHTPSHGGFEGRLDMRRGGQDMNGFLSNCNEYIRQP